ncbi:MAG: DUF4157 domain-containing protein [Acidobacteriaceae bacterium]
MSYALLAKRAESIPLGRESASSKGSSCLKINTPGDAFEREADRAVDAVVSQKGAAPAWSLSRMSIAAPLQRKCSCGGGSEGECTDCAQRETLQRRTSGDLSAVPPIVHDVLNSPGRSLDAKTRSFFEPRFGHDFGKVRIHTGPEAAASASAVHAVAYTVGHDIVFGESRYAPSSRQGHELLAHELSHVIQQDGGGSSPGKSTLKVGAAGDSFEHDAARAAHQVLHAAPHVQAREKTGGALGFPFPKRSSTRIQRSARLYVARQCVNPDICGQYKTVRECPKGRPCGYGKSGTCQWPSMKIGCCCLGAKEKTPVEVPAEAPEKKTSPEDAMRRLRELLPAFVIALIGAAALVALAACFASGACEVGAILAGASAAVVLLVAAALRHAGVLVRDAPGA